MTSQTELLPCPFCGGEAEKIDFGPGDGENEGGSCITCTKCQSSGPVEFGFKENFISNWNHRATPAPSEVLAVAGEMDGIARADFGTLEAWAARLRAAVKGR